MTFGSASIGAVFDVRNGATPAADNPAYWEGEIPWVTPADLGSLEGRTISRGSRFITEEGYASCGTQMVPVGSLVLSIRAPIGHLAIASVPLAFNQGCRGLVPRSSIRSDYAYWAHLSVKPDLEAAGQGSTFMELSRSKLRSIRIPLPPLNQQHAIADFLDRETGRIDALITKKERLKAILGSRLDAKVALAVTRGIESDTPLVPSDVPYLGQIPGHWTVAKVGLRYSVQLGKMLDGAKITGERLRPYLRVADVQWGAINTRDLPQMDFSEQDEAKFRLEAGDLLVNEGGSFVGRSAVWAASIADCYYQKALHRMRPLDRRQDDSQFMYYVMRFATKRGVFIGGGNQTTIDHLTAVALRRYRFAFPPLLEQRQIVESLIEEEQSSNRLIELIDRSIDRLRELRSALITAAVTGQIDPADWRRRGETDRSLEAVEVAGAPAGVAS